MIMQGQKATESLLQKKKWIATTINLNRWDSTSYFLRCSLAITTGSSTTNSLTSTPSWFPLLATLSSFSSLLSLNAMSNLLMNTLTSTVSPLTPLNVCLSILPSHSLNNHLFFLLLLLVCQALLEKLYNCWFMPWHICGSQTHLDL